MELRHLRYFTAVVEAGSFSAAAQALHLAQPSLSVAIGKLEASVGVALLVRSPRGVEPTSAGRYLLDAAAGLLSTADDIVETLGRFGAGTTGRVSLAVVPTLLWHRLPRLLRAFAKAAPDVEVRLTDPPPWTAIDMLARRTVDVAMIMVDDGPRFAKRHRGQFDIVDGGDIPLVAALPPTETDTPDPLPLQAFEGHTLVLPQRTAAVPSLPEAVEDALRACHVTPGAVRTAETIQTSIPFIEAGTAWGILPDPDGASLGRFDLVTRPLHPAPRPLRSLVLVRPGAAQYPVIDRLLACLSSARAADPVR
ncbi:LysR family transcriptional regulator [Microbacterium protaetiae]|uniref:LysR family transcriptional regulator n=1 Tax=Microbacterium protaetiae TaxID=2509458 RepID=A0A4V0YD86_9MICO|nr:LysR family transcriptional regulator [Microbacterium protaetiae]QAY59841.1 LysR family transcriptional regulator [Microbacterium protaetiae]